MKKIAQTQLAQELQHLPAHYRENFSREFLQLIAALRLHDFLIVRADEAYDEDSIKRNMYIEAGHPSVWIHSLEAAGLQARLRQAEPESAEYEALLNKTMRANLLEQQRLLGLLERFYNNHIAPSFYARLIVETIDLGETCLKAQGGSVRLVLADEASRQQWLESMRYELAAFTSFLVDGGKVS